MISLSERLESAALALSGPQCIKDRLFTAWSQYLADLELRDFPRDLRDEFEAMRDALGRERALPGDSILKASLRKLSADEAARFAALIIRTYGCVAALKSPQVTVLTRNAPPAVILADRTRSAGG